MNLHEYQGKALFREYGLPVSSGVACDTADEVLAAAKQIGEAYLIERDKEHRVDRFRRAFKRRRAAREA